MTTSFGGDQQPDPAVADTGHEPGELPVEPSIADRLGGFTVASGEGTGDPGSWRPMEWPAPPGATPALLRPPEAPIPGLVPPIQLAAPTGQPPPGAGYSPPELAGGSSYYPSDDFGDEASRVRPYAWTRGRTRSSVSLQLETLVSTSDLGQDEGALTQVEYRAVGALCRHPHSVAEVAAKLSVPLGVAKVILSDMAELGLISIHRTFADDDIAAHLVLMERVLSGLRRL